MAAKRGTILLLSICYALSVSTIALNVAIAPLVGAQLAPDPRLSTLPVSLQILATMAASFPASMAMGRWGRRTGHVAATLVGACGAAIAALAIHQQGFALYCLGTTLMGALNAAAQLYRFTAADARPEAPAKAIGWVMAGGVAAGVVGPALAVHGAGLASTRFVGSYALAVGAFAIVSVLLLPLRLPIRIAQAEGPTRPLQTIVTQPQFVAAALAAMMAYGVMSLVMTAAPLHMSRTGHPLTSSSLAIQWHVVAMFAPSFVTGHIISRTGERPVMAAGLACYVATLAVHLHGGSLPHHVAGLILLGLGWNLLFTSGTTLLRAAHNVAETAKTQGINDVLVFGTAGTASLAAGALLSTIGWMWLQVAAVPLLIIAAWSMKR